MPEIDPITLEVVKNALGSTADEMALVVMGALEVVLTVVLTTVLVCPLLAVAVAARL